MNKIKNIIYATIAVFFMLFSSVKQPILAQAPTPSVTNANNTKSLLWEITGNEIKQPSYLYGTIHLIPKNDFFLTDATKKAFDASKRVTFEINMKEMNNPMALMSIMTKALMSEGKRLKDLVNESDYNLVQNHFDSIGLPLKMLERIKPMFLSVMVGNDGEQMSLTGEDSASKKSTSYEMEFMQMADKQKKDFGGLETVEFQMSIFDSIPYKAQADMLVKTIKDKSSGNDEFKTMVDMYKAQDIEAMSKMLGSGEQSDLGQYENMLIVKRNKSWIPIMSKMMKEKQTFFAVGAGHLGGELGVVNLLRQAGYKVTPLN